MIKQAVKLINTYLTFDSNFPKLYIILYINMTMHDSMLCALCVTVNITLWFEERVNCKKKKKKMKFCETI